MLSDFTGADRIYLAVGYTDLRKGIERLAPLVRRQFELDPFTNTLFCSVGGEETDLKRFIGKKTDSCCYINDWRRETSIGRAAEMRYDS